MLFLIEQMTASLLMAAIYPNYTLKSNLDRYRRENLETKHINLLNYATSLFVKNANPNAYLIAFNLEKLSGYIPDSVLKTYATKTIESAKAWFLDGKNCTGCSITNNSNTSSRKTKLVEKEIADLKKYTN